MSLQVGGIQSNGLSPTVAGYSKKLSYFNKKVDRLIGRNEPTQVLMEVTPEMACEMLLRNRELNRKIGNRFVSVFAADMKAGRWSVTGQGLAFDTNGKLLDGQHRLQACIDSGATFKTWVAFGIDPESFIHHDRGQSRQNGQLFQMAGFSNGNQMAVAVRFVVLFNQGNISMSGREHGLTTMDHNQRPVVDELIAWAEARPDFSKLLIETGRIYSQATGLAKSYAFALHWVIRQKYPQKGDIFIARLCMGVDVTLNDPIHKLRQKLERIRHDDKHTTPSAWKAAFVIKAFNAWNKNTRLDHFKIGGSETFPQVK